jgi:hypothetical protein
MKLQYLRRSIEWVQLLEFLGKSIISGKPDIEALRESFKFKERVESISGFEKKFEELVDACNIQRLVVFIDDLDRCKMEATFDILEATKLLLNSKDCVYVLGLDYRRICDAISVVVGKGSEEYLDKIIQLPFHIPRRTEEDMKIYLRYLFALRYLEEERVREFATAIKKIKGNIDDEFPKLLKNYVKEISMDEYKAISKHDLLIIKENNFNPRKIKRFLNIYELRCSLSKVLYLDLEYEYVIKFLLLQIKFSDFYRDLENQSEILNEINRLKQIDNEVELKRALEKSKSSKKILKKHYSNEELLHFLGEVNFGDVDPRPYLRIAETARVEVVLGDSLERIFSQMEGRISKREFRRRVREKIEEFGGLLSEKGAAIIVATDLGIDLKL